MKHIYSKKDIKKLLHVINRLSDISYRTDISHTTQFLQLATLKMNKGKKFKAHQHIWKPSPTENIIAQESWVVIKGSAKIYMYDIDGKLLHTEILNPGDCSVTFEGGHAYEILEDDTIIYEYKTGPYLGVEKDKIFYE
jgi:hypothetical protein